MYHVRYKYNAIQIQDWERRGGESADKAHTGREEPGLSGHTVPKQVPSITRAQELPRTPKTRRLSFMASLLSGGQMDGPPPPPPGRHAFFTTDAVGLHVNSWLHPACVSPRVFSTSGRCSHSFSADLFRTPRLACLCLMLCYLCIPPFPPPLPRLPRKGLERSLISRFNGSPLVRKSETGPAGHEASSHQDDSDSSTYVYVCPACLPTTRGWCLPLLPKRGGRLLVCRRQGWMGLTGLSNAWKVEHGRACDGTTYVCTCLPACLPRITFTQPLGSKYRY